VHQPPSVERRRLKYDAHEIAEHVARIRSIPATER
jgi:hypothetical protein